MYLHMYNDVIASLQCLHSVLYSENYRIKTTHARGQSVFSQLKTISSLKIFAETDSLVCNFGSPNELC